MPLRTRLIALYGVILLLLLSGLAVSLSLQQRSTIRRQLELRGESVARSLAAASQMGFRTYDYIELSRLAEMAALDKDITYVILHDKEGRVAGFSGRSDLLLTELDDPETSAALASASCIVQPGRTASAVECLEVAMPASGPEGRWGTVRVGMSLTPIREQMRRTLGIIGFAGAMGLICGWLAILWASSRITNPLARLTQATQEVAAGDFSQSLHVESRDEVGILAENFSQMVAEVVAQRRELERRLYELTRLQAYTRGVLESMSEGVVSIDVHGVAATVNPAAERVFASLGLDVRAGCPFPPPDMDGDVAESLERLLEGGRSRSATEVEIGDGEDARSLLVSGSDLDDPAEGRRERILTFLDVTELKRLEAQVRRSERLAALGTLAAGMAHEIRNPLAAIKTYVSLLPRKIEKPGFLEKFERTVPREIGRINDLLEDLMDLSRSQSFSFAPLDIETFAREACDVYAGEIERRGVRLALRFLPGLPPAKGDQDQLAKVLGNLIRNALQAMEPGGRLTIVGGYGEGEPEAEMLCLSVEDTGAGMPPDVLENIFNPFFTTKNAGTGLGLAIAHKVIQEHGGRIRATSRQGEGTRFSFTLPAWSRRSGARVIEAD